MVMRCCTVVEQNGTMLKHFWLFTVQSQPHSKTGPWLLYQLARDGSAQVHFCWRTWCAWLPKHPNCSMYFSSLVTFGQAIQHSAVSYEGQMTASMTRQLLKCDQGLHWLNFFNTADGWQLEHAWLFGYHRAHVESTLHKLFFSPSCWWGYSKHLL